MHHDQTVAITMGKEASLEGLEFDGETVLCRVCGDKASGFHYGVHACEGCKGFFRRSIQQKIQYRPCLKNQQCNIMRVNRNRCQYCRLKKCISVGMSRDAVRFGRVPKKEKARIMEQMQRVNSQSHTMAIDSIIDNEKELVDLVISAHKLTNEFTLERVQMLRKEARINGAYVNCPSHMACPLNVNVQKDQNSDQGGWDEFSEYFTPAIRSVVDFAKSIPGFVLLSQDDQVTLLKAGTFEVLLLRFVSLFDPATNTMLFTNGKLFKRPATTTSGCAGFLLDSMFDFADRFSKLRLSEEEHGLFSGIILLAPDRPGLRNVDQIEKIQNKMTHSLQTMVSINHLEDPTLFAKLLMKTTDLRTLNTLHSEKLIEPDQQNNKVTDALDMSVADLYASLNSSSRDNISVCPMDTSDGASGVSIPKDLRRRNSLDAPSIDINGMPMQRFDPGHRLDSSHRTDTNGYHKSMVQTPYGTFYRDDSFYGFMGDQPRQRCHTMDTATRPRLHVIDEGNRRRYTMDREYISKMMVKLNNRLEKRATEDPTPSLSSSSSSPVQHDDLYAGYRDFIPVKPDTSASGCSSRGSPIDGFSPSPNPRSRSSSFTDKDYSDMRRRCYSFHLSSDGRAARGMVRPPQLDTDRFSDGEKQSSDSRRGSVGAAFGLYNHKKSLLVDRSSAYLSQSPDLFKYNKRPSNPDISESFKYQRMDLPRSAMSTSPRHLTPPRTIDTPPARVSPLVDTLVIPRVPVPSSTITCPKTEISQPMESPRASENNQQQENYRSENSVVRNSQITSTTHDDKVDKIEENERKNPEPEPEPMIENVVHKKFDRVRKHQLSATITKVEFDRQNVAKTTESEKSAVSVSNSDKALTNPDRNDMDTTNAPNRVDQSMEEDNDNKLIVDENAITETTSDDKLKPASQTHPQLMAYLQQSSPGSSHPSPSKYPNLQEQLSHGFTSQSFTASGSSIPAGLSLETRSSETNLISDLKNMSMTNRNNNNGYVINGDKVMKDQVHAAAMLNLKDKLLRKIDSMENLNKIPPEKVSPAEKSTSATTTSGNAISQPTRTQSQNQAAMYSALYGSHLAAAMYPQYLGYNNLQRLQMLSQQTYAQQLQAMQQYPHLYGNGPLVRADGQALNLSKPLDELSQLAYLAASPMAKSGSHQTSPSNQLRSPSNHHTSPSNQHTSPRNSYVSPSNQHTSPSNSYISSSSNHTSPNNSYISPPSHHTSPSNHHMSPSNHFPSHHNQPHEQSLSPTDQQLPSNHHISPGNHQILPGNNHVSPGNQQSPSNHKILPSNQNTPPNGYSHSLSKPKIIASDDR